MSTIAQLTEPDLPFAFNLEETSLANPMEIEVPPPEVSDLWLGINERKKQKLPIPIGKEVLISMDLIDKMSFSEVEGGKLGRCLIRSDGAAMLGVNFEDLYLPIGSKLFVYSPDKTEKFGPFSHLDAGEGVLSSGVITGEEIIVEVFMPERSRQDARLTTSGIAYIIEPSSQASRDFGDADDCHINIACREGDDWQDQKNSVVRILMYINGKYGWCTGTIMNNTFQDCKPYILTADHCRQVEAGSVATTEDYNRWQFFFNYEGDKCRDPKEEDVPVGKIEGCTLKASSGKMAEGDPDFLLVELNEEIQSFYNPFFAGWDNRNVTSTAGVMIHHPAGDIKKISTYTQTTETSEWDEKQKNTHWKVYWAETRNGRGVSQSGSSGSALWNNDKRVMGQLSGGASGCVDDGNNSPTNPDYFGKMSFGWFMDPNDNTKQLKAWLDEGNSLRPFVDGIKWPCSEDPLGALELQEISAEITLYPNPVVSNLVVSNILSRDVVSVSVYDTKGSAQNIDVSHKKSSLDIDIETLSPGIYILAIETGQGPIQKKFVKD